MRMASPKDVSPSSTVEPDGLAEVTPHEIPEEHRVLHGQGPVQAQLRAQPEYLALRRVGREEERGGIAR